MTEQLELRWVYWGKKGWTVRLVDSESSCILGLAVKLYSEATKTHIFTSKSGKGI